MTIDRKTFGLPRRRREGGFTLIEMMVALALSLIVTAAVIALVVAIVRSNRQTLQATRLHRNCARRSTWSRATCGARVRSAIR